MSKKKHKYQEEITYKEQLDYIFADRVLSDDSRHVRIAEGIPMAVNETYQGRQLVGIPQGKEGHAIIFGGSGSGKTSGPIMAALNTWQGPMVVTDPKGELYSYYQKLYDRGLVKRPAILFDPTREVVEQQAALSDSTQESCKNQIEAFDTTDEKSVRYDPFWFLKQDKNDLIGNITALAHAIAPKPHNCREPYWIETTQALIEAGILYYYRQGFNFSETVTALISRKLSKTLEEILSDDDPLLKIIIGSTAKLRGGELASHDRELRNALMVFVTDQRINDAFDCDWEKDNFSFCWDDLRNFNIFIRIPEERIEQWSAPMRLMLTQLFTYLGRRSDKSISNNEPPVLLLLDEVARFGKIEGLSNALCTLRSKNVNILLALQSLAQLDMYYGVNERRIICENCCYKLILQAGDPETQKVLSDLIGVHKTRLHSKGRTTDPADKITSYNYNKSEAYLKRVFPHELATLEDAILLSPHGFEQLEKIRVYDRDFEELLSYQLLTAMP